MNATEPKLAATLNTVLIEELDAYQSKYNKAKTSETKQFIEERIIDVEKESFLQLTYHHNYIS